MPQEKHPSYGKISVSRVTSTVGPSFYGSKLRHSNYIQFTLKQSTLERRLNEDRLSDAEPIIEVRMTENQFAHLITTLNTGGGTPCTIQRRIVGDRYVQIESPPATDEQSLVRKEFAEKAKKTVEGLTATLKALQALTSPGAKVSKSALQQIQKDLEAAVQDVAMNMPEITETFERTLDDTTAAAKADIEAHLQQILGKLKLNGITEGFSVSMIEGPTDGSNP